MVWHIRIFYKTYILFDTIWLSKGSKGIVARWDTSTRRDVDGRWSRQLPSQGLIEHRIFVVGRRAYKGRKVENADYNY